MHQAGSLYCEGIEAAREFEPLVGSTRCNGKISCRIVGKGLNEAPLWTPEVAAPAGEFGRASDVVYVRALSGLVGAISADGTTVTYYYDGAPPQWIVGVVLDEFCALARDVRGNLCLHAALIVSPDREGFLLLGDSGTGKSTAAMITALAPGWSAACDDSVIIVSGDQGVMGYPSYPGIRLRKEAAEMLCGEEWSTRWTNLRQCLSPEKRRILLPDCEAVNATFFNDPVAIRGIVDLRPSESLVALNIEPSEVGYMVRRLIWSAYAVPVLGVEADVRRFDQATSLVRDVESFTAHYSRTPASISELLGILSKI